MSKQAAPAGKGAGGGGGNRRPAPYPRGRRVNDGALAEIRELLGAGEPRRHLLIEYLHRIQDSHGYIGSAHLMALAHELRLSQAEVHEVATFYAHFDVVAEDGTPPPPLTVRVCDGIACEMAGGGALAQELSLSLAETLGERVRIVRAPCVGACDRAPAAVVGRRQIAAADTQAVASAAAAGECEPRAPAFRDFDAYRAGGGYRILAQCLDGGRRRQDLIATIEASGLRGLGGAGFPVARKWRFLIDATRPRVLVVNADEGEPGTFKDRHCLETDPHRVLEGALLAAFAVEAEETVIYLRDEYPWIHQLLAQEIPKVQAAGLLGGTSLDLRRGAGSYVCGEETALLESLEGKRGLPRNRPPYPAQAGLFGRPTLVNNVESLFWVTAILEKGAEWFIEAGRPRLYSVSGRVREPGVKTAPSGITLNRLIEDHCGGMADGHRLEAYLPGGASGGILPAAMADLPLDFGSLESQGCFIGSAAVVVLSDHDDIRAVVRNLLRFMEDESCGQCTPCRVGTEKMVRLTEGSAWDADLIGELAEAMKETSICGLGQAAPNPVLSALRFFAGEVT